MGNLHDSGFCQEECHTHKHELRVREEMMPTSRCATSRASGVPFDDNAWRPSRGPRGVQGQHRAATARQAAPGRGGPPEQRQPTGRPPPWGSQSRDREREGGQRSHTMFENPFADYAHASRQGTSQNRSASMFANPYKEHEMFRDREGPGVKSSGSRSSGPASRRASRDLGGTVNSRPSRSRPLPEDDWPPRVVPTPSPSRGLAFSGARAWASEPAGPVFSVRQPDFGPDGIPDYWPVDAPGPWGPDGPPPPDRSSWRPPNDRAGSPSRVEDTTIGRGFGEFLKRGVAQAVPRKDAGRAEMRLSKDGGFIATIQKGFEGIFGHLAATKEEVLRKRGPMSAPEYEAVPGDEMDQRVQRYARKLPPHLGECLKIYRVSRGRYQIGADEVRLAWQSRVTPPNAQHPAGGIAKELFVYPVPQQEEDEDRDGSDVLAERSRGGKERAAAKQAPCESLPLFLRHSANIAYDLQFGNNGLSQVPECNRLSFADEEGTLLEHGDADAKYNAMTIATEQARKREAAAQELLRKRSPGRPCGGPSHEAGPVPRGPSGETLQAQCGRERKVSSGSQQTQSTSLRERTESLGQATLTPLSWSERSNTGDLQGAGPLPPVAPAPQPAPPRGSAPPGPNPMLFGSRMGMKGLDPPQLKMPPPGPWSGPGAGPFGGALPPVAGYNGYSAGQMTQGSHRVPTLLGAHHPFATSYPVPMGDLNGARLR